MSVFFNALCSSPISFFFLLPTSTFDHIFWEIETVIVIANPFSRLLTRDSYEPKKIYMQTWVLGSTFQILILQIKYKVLILIFVGILVKSH